jgi:dinuclear metal center YbgI/SA1388 family protein
MNLAEINQLLNEKISPKEYKIKSEVYGLHYSEGNGQKIIKKVILTVDLNLEVIHYAILNKINLIISHHGLFRSSFKNFNPSLIKKLKLLSNYPISIYVLNTPFVCAEGGISETLMNILYLELDDIFKIQIKSYQKIPIGRICHPETFDLKKSLLTLENILERIKINLKMSQIHYVGTLKRIIKKICLIGGEFINESVLTKAKSIGCDCVISFKIDHHLAGFARDIDLVLIAVSHYQTENISLRKLCNILSLEYPKCEFSLYDSNDPQQIYT